MPMITFSNKEFTPEKPTADQIELLDIAVALSRIPRFVGHTHHTYSVAEHSILVSELARRKGKGDPNRIKLLSLFHDAAEAYTSDIPSPIKAMLKPAIVEVEDRIMDAIYKKFDLAPPNADEKQYIKSLDTKAYEIENGYLRDEVWTALLDPSKTGKTLPCMTSDQAALAFMRQYRILSEEK